MNGITLFGRRKSDSAAPALFGVVAAVVVVGLTIFAATWSAPVANAQNCGGNSNNPACTTPTAIPTATTIPTPTPTPVPPPVPAAEPLNTAAEFRVAFFADTGFEDLNQQDRLYPYDYLETDLGLPGRTMKLVYAEGAEFALHGGDIGYDTTAFDIPARWDAMVTGILGADYPLFASGGNHDERDWDSALFNSGPGYATVLNNRYLAAEANPAIGPNLDCTFPNSSAQDIGQKGTCVYKNTLTAVTVGLGAAAPDGERPTGENSADNSFEAYLDGALASSTTPWTVCNWHFNQSNLQTGYKSNEAGWKPYEYCREAGALIATGHEHSYSRTHLLGRFAEDMHVGDIVATGADLTIDEGETVAWVSGLGGRSIRTVSGEAQNPWWAAKVNATNQSTTHGAGVLFCDFKTDGNANAQCYYKTVDGQIRDRFELVSNANGATGTYETPPTSTNIAPTASLADQTSVRGDLEQVRVVATDGDGPLALTYHAEGLPAGLTLNASTGWVVGTPTGSGSFPVTVWVWDGADSTEFDLTWTVLTPTPVPTPTATATPIPTATPTPTAVPTATTIPTTIPTPVPTAVSTGLLEASMSVYCVNGSGWIDVTVENIGGTAAQAKVSVQNLDDRYVNLLSGDSARVRRTGRRDGAHTVVVSDAANVAFFSDTAWVSCADPITSSCLAGNGRIDVSMLNTTAADATYVVTFGSLAPRSQLIPASTSHRFTVTGRPDGPLPVTVSRNGAIVVSEVVEVDCDPDIPTPSQRVVVSQSCLASNGRIDIDLYNNTAISGSFFVFVGNLAARQHLLAPGESADETVTGRPDGPISVRVSRNGVMEYNQMLTIACD